MNKEEIKLYVIPGKKDNNGEGKYYLLTENGEALYSHFCSNICFAKSDLIGSREERKKELKEKYGSYKVLYIGDDNLTYDELLERNKKFYGDSNE